MTQGQWIAIREAFHRREAGQTGYGNGARGARAAGGEGPLPRHPGASYP